jgi:hypothetical protein
MDTDWTAGRVKSEVLNVRIYPPSPATSRTLQTDHGAVRWALEDQTLFIDADRHLAPSGRNTEHLVRSILRSAGLASRYSVYRLEREPSLSSEEPLSRPTAAVALGV